MRKPWTLAATAMVAAVWVGAAALGAVAALLSDRWLAGPDEAEHGGWTQVAPLGCDDDAVRDALIAAPA